MEEIEKRKELDEKRESDIQQLEGEIRILNERTTVMESKMEEERDEEKKNEAITEKEELERRLTRVTNKRKVEKKEMEELERKLAWAGGLDASPGGGEAGGLRGAACSQSRSNHVRLTSESTLSRLPANVYAQSSQVCSQVCSSLGSRLSCVCESVSGCVSVSQ